MSTLRKSIVLAVVVAVCLAGGALGQQTRSAPSGSNTGSPQAKNENRRLRSLSGQAVNTRTGSASGSAQGGTHNGVRNPGSSARASTQAASAQKTSPPATGGDAGQGTPGVHSKRKTNAQKYSAPSGPGPR